MSKVLQVVLGIVLAGGILAMVGLVVVLAKLFMS